ncbi:MAG: LysR family transcriptional regulator [Albidovulum sp.]|uniref:LysR family transcriptional regulator n=1 Tax=Albidovulum sp. TaxID=1872424 RepID=UPI003CC48910
MPRNLDLTALRALVAVADSGGVTRAAGLLNLTQSAVSMQIKRLEEGLGQAFFTRSQRKLTLTLEGEQLLSYARKMLDLNDQALSRLTDSGYEGELRLGVPCDIVYPQIPAILKALAREFPRVRINLVSSFTQVLQDGFGRGEFDMILTTETEPLPGGEVLASRDMTWVGAPDGAAWQRRPLRLGFMHNCIFRLVAQAALDEAGILWEMAFDGHSEQVVEATVAADLAITARLKGNLPEGLVAIEPGNILPPLGQMSICFYDAGMHKGPVAEALRMQLRCAYADLPAQPRSVAAE